MPSKDAKILIAGSGVFGLTSALHLVQSGYTNITILDRLDLYSMGYTFTQGADTASADINKVFRAFYAGDEMYHRLALQAKEEFLKWDKEVRALSPEEAKDKFNMTDKLRILDPCGSLRLDNSESLPEYMLAELRDFENSGLRQTQYILNDPEDVARAVKDGLADKVTNLFGTGDGSNPYIKRLSGLYDNTSGLLYAYNACLYVNAYLRRHGVKFITGSAGTIKEVMYEEDECTGFLTVDGVKHTADLCIVACGPWTASLIPELAGLSEAQNGNVLCIKIPEDRPDLLEKYSTEKFSLVMWKGGKSQEREKYAGFGVFPISTSDGLVKFVVRQRKYNNPTTLTTGQVTSIPVTSQSSPPETRITEYIVSQVKQFIKVFLPDLVEFGIHTTRLLWYTDTINNDFIIDDVPGKKNVVVVTGGSGHGFKFLPVLGQFVVDHIEGRENECTRRFKWRDPSAYKDINTIGTVETGENAYYSQELATEADYVFTQEEIDAPVEF